MFHDLYEEGIFPLLASEEIPESGKTDQMVENHCYELSLPHCCKNLRRSAFVIARVKP
jgi:hypothetical protein